MKLLYIISNYGIASETFIVDLIDGLSTTDIELTVIADTIEGQAPDFVSGEAFITNPKTMHRLKWRMPWCNPQRYNEYNLSKKIELTNKSLLKKIHGESYDVAYIDYGNICTLVQRALVEKEIPFVVHFHGADISKQLNMELYRQELQFCFENAAGLICASNHIRRLLILEGAPEHKIKLIRYGVNLEGISPVSWGERKNKSVIFLGRLTEKKHPVALVEAFSIAKEEHPEAMLTLIGKGPERHRVEYRIKKLGLTDSVSILGELSRNEALKIVSQHWIYAQHSVTAKSGDQEGFGISLIEAAALGLPVVSTFHNGIPESVLDGETGLLCHEFDYETMGLHLSKLLSNRKLCEELGNAGKGRVNENFVQSDRVQKIKDYLESIFS